ncbi:MAG TPA: tail fiber domain-containing protein, partial [Acidimicrobiia bacterium]|nr:tail fiber domain-containing protein [Acidimicrobiia bacterium]
PFPAAKLDVRGDARVEGNVSLGSSRTLKADFDAVDPAEVLANLADLPVASWRYKTEDETARHIGPFAEDFQRLFGVGDSNTISVVDAQGVALAAIQGLQERVAAKESELEQRLAEKETELERLRRERDAQIAELTARLAALEDRLDAE